MEENTTTTIATKRCSKCGKELPLSEFHKHSKAKDGLQSWCKHCTVVANANYNASKRAKNTPPNQLQSRTLSFQKCSRVKYKMKSVSV